jgi:hypothetical protein
MERMDRSRCVDGIAWWYSDMAHQSGIGAFGAEVERWGDASRIGASRRLAVGAGQDAS